MFVLWNGNLSLVMPGYFASDAYLEGGLKAMDKIAGDKFGVFSADDSKKGYVNKHNIVPVTSEQIAEMWDLQPLEWRLGVKIWLSPKPTLSDRRDEVKRYRDLCNTMSILGPLYHNLLEEYKPLNIAAFFIKKYCI